MAMFPILPIKLLKYSSAGFQSYPSWRIREIESEWMVWRGARREPMGLLNEIA
jgi:hypothetical protein